MFCTDKEKETCNVEKMGCKGCHYFYDENKIETSMKQLEIHIANELDDEQWDNWQEVLKYIKEIEEDRDEWQKIVIMQNDREYRSKFLKEFQEEHNENTFPDYDEIYKRYDEQKNHIKELSESNKELDKECSRLEKKEVEMEKELQLKDKVIDEMAKSLEHYTGSCPNDLYNWEEIDCENECGNSMKKCWKQYFINKVKGENK